MIRRPPRSPLFPYPTLSRSLGDLGLADPRLAFEEQRAAHAQREEQHGRQRPVGEVIGAREQREGLVDRGGERADRKSTRLNSSHGYISYAGLCFKKKKTRQH